MSRKILNPTHKTQITWVPNGNTIFPLTRVWEGVHEDGTPGRSENNVTYRSRDEEIEWLMKPLWGQEKSDWTFPE